MPINAQKHFPTLTVHPVAGPGGIKIIVMDHEAAIQVPWPFGWHPVGRLVNLAVSNRYQYPAFTLQAFGIRPLSYKLEHPAG
jgi:hypothetical protein